MCEGGVHVRPPPQCVVGGESGPGGGRHGAGDADGTGAATVEAVEVVL